MIQVPEGRLSFVTDSGGHGFALPGRGKAPSLHKKSDYPHDTIRMTNLPMAIARKYVQSCHLRVQPLTINLCSILYKSTRISRPLKLGPGQGVSMPRFRPVSPSHTPALTT